MKYRLGMKGIAALVSVAVLLLSVPARIHATEGSVPAEEEVTEEGTPEDGGSGQTEPEEGEPERETKDAVSWPEGPSIEGESGILMEASTGMILYSKNIHAQYYPASITKILTALLVMENCDMDDLVTVPHEAVYMDEDKGSHIALDEGEVLTVKDCLYGLLLASANDAAYALAIHVSGSIEEFAALMNSRAQELGCGDSHFMNPHGLPNEQHLTSAYDMALITREALKHDVFREISGTVYYEIPPSDKQPDQIPLSNHHRMLTATPYHYDGVFAGKTGYTVVAKNTLVTCAARDGMELICVTMKTEGRQVYVDTAALFDFGFEAFHRLGMEEHIGQSAAVRVHARTGGKESGEAYAQILPIQVTQDGGAVVPAEVSFDDLELELYYDTENAGQGEEVPLECSYGGQTVGSAMILLPAPLVVPEETQVQEPEEAMPEEEESAGKWEFRWQYAAAGAIMVAGLAVAGFLIGRRMVWRNRWRRRSESLSAYVGSRRRKRRRGFGRRRWR